MLPSLTTSCNHHGTYMLCTPIIYLIGTLYCIHITEFINLKKSDLQMVHANYSDTLHGGKTWWQVLAHTCDRFSKAKSKMAYSVCVCLEKLFTRDTTLTVREYRKVAKNWFLRRLDVYHWEQSHSKRSLNNKNR